MKKVTIYSTSTCHFCEKAKEFFNKHNVKYTVIDVGADLTKRREMIEKSGQMGVPVIVIGKEMIVGYNESRLKVLLKID